MTDGTSGARGTTYELRFCMLCVVRGYTKGLTNFRLRYQAPESEVGKFDDVVFDEGGEKYQVFQLKHKEIEGKHKINSSELFHENFSADFNLLKYVISYFQTLKGKVSMAVVLTNIDFYIQNNDQLKLLSNRKGWFQELEYIQLRPLTPHDIAIFDTTTTFPKSKCYQFDNDKNFVSILKRQSETVLKELPEKPKKQKYTKPTEKDEVKTFAEKQQKTKSCTNINLENPQKKLKGNTETLANVLKNLTEDDIREALQHIVYAVRQPNDTELKEIIKNKIQDYFKLQNVDTVYNALENAITEWCNKKEPFIYEVPTSNPHEIYFRDAEIFFQQNVKNISFCDNAPTSSFTGRLDELNLIREKLVEKHDLIVSQSVTIVGLGGIGKTELTKQFIKEYGQSDFYGRVIWIEAESDESVKKSFTALAEIVDIPDRENKLTTTIINQIFDYFHGVKVLFVFDNFDKNYECSVKSSNFEEKNFVIYCRRRASASMKKHRPHFIFTSRNRECLPGVFSFNLSILTKEDANELIKKKLIIKSYTDQDVDELTKTLQYFPLALQQATAYINKQYEIQSVSGGGYDIKKYLKEFAKKKEKLLNYPVKNDFGEHGQTTLVTWSVTFDAIKQDKINGPDAIKILQFMSYLYADKIDSKMFLPLFEKDTTRHGEAFLLLQKYSLVTKIGESTFYQIHRLVQTVVQLTFEIKEEVNPKAVWKFIFPKLFESYIDQNEESVFRLMAECTADQILHYNNLATFIKNNGGENKRFMEFFDKLQNRVLNGAIQKDDIEKIIELQLSQEALKKIAINSLKYIIESNARKVIKYFVDNGILDLNNVSLLIHSINYDNFYLLQYFVEKGANLNDLELKASTDLIQDIIKGKSDSLMDLIKSEKTEESVTILKESLFFATLFNQESIIELLIANKVQPDYILCEAIEFSPIRVASKLGYPNILKLLLTYFDKPEFKDKVIFFLTNFFETHCDINCFEIIFKKYLELGGDVNDQHVYLRWGTTFERNTFLCLFTDPVTTDTPIDIEIVNFLLDNGADPLIKDENGEFALFNVFWKINLDPDQKDLLKDVFKKMRSKISNEKIITVISRVLIRFVYYYNDYNKGFKMKGLLFEKNDVINLRDEEGGTILMNFVRTLKNYCRIKRYEYIVEFILELGVDVDAKDNDGKDALFYAVDLESSEIFNFLLPKVSSVSEDILIKAITLDQAEIVEELLKNHFKLNHTFEDGKTIIEVVLDNLSIETMFLFRHSIKKLNFQEGQGERIAKKSEMALIKCIKRYSNRGPNVNLEILDFCFDLGADVNAIDSDNNNALHYASDLKSNETLEYLLSKGSFVQENTLELAIHQDKLQIVKAIIPKYYKKNHRFASGSTPINLASSYLSNNVLTYLNELS